MSYIDNDITSIHIGEKYINSITSRLIKVVDVDEEFSMVIIETAMKGSIGFGQTITLDEFCAEYALYFPPINPQKENFKKFYERNFNNG